MQEHFCKPSIIQDRICLMNNDILYQIVTYIKLSNFKISIQLDESTDVLNCSQLIALARYVINDEINEDFLFCKELVKTTMATDIFDDVKIFFKENNLNINKVASICTDGAPALLGNKSCFLILVFTIRSLFIFPIFYLFVYNKVLLHYLRKSCLI